VTEGEPQIIHLLALGWVLLCWIGYTAPFVLRKRPPKTPERKRDRTSLVGIALQSVAYALVWSVRRPLGTPLVSLGPAWDWIGPVLVMLLGSVSVWMVGAAVWALGKQWSFAARLTEGHRLVQEGPYRIVRHPIYSAMGGMLLATGLALSHWVAILPGLIFFGIGTAIRIRSEEKLLKEAFGSEFDAYVRRVGAVLPRLALREDPSYPC